MNYYINQYINYSRNIVVVSSLSSIFGLRFQPKCYFFFNEILYLAYLKIFCFYTCMHATIALILFKIHYNLICPYIIVHVIYMCYMLPVYILLPTSYLYFYISVKSLSTFTFPFTT